jgi:F-type H+-transporting ATPase subunit b
MILFTLLAAVDPAEGTVSKIAGVFGVTWWKLLSQGINFGILAWVLKTYAYKPILKVLEDRRNKIAEGLKNAEEIKKQLAEAQKQSGEIIGQANVAASKMIEEARAAAKALQERESQRAIAEAEQIIVKARETTNVEHAKMLADLKREVARLVIDTTTKVTGKILTPDDHKRLSEDAARELAA